MTNLAFALLMVLLAAGDALPPLLEFVRLANQLMVVWAVACLPSLAAAAVVAVVVRVVDVWDAVAQPCLQ